MPLPIRLTCVLCDRQYGEGPQRYSCPRCGELGTLRVDYDYGRVQRDIEARMWPERATFDQWRYAPLLPLGTAPSAFPLRVGGTPLYAAARLREQLGLTDLWLKDDTLNPSASLKDRASSLVLLKGRELGYTEFATASTGNAGASLACMAASAGVRCHIFVPQSAPRAKVAQLVIYGAHVLAIRGSYSEAFTLCVESSRKFGWYNRNTGYNPYTVEGKKTVSFEVVEQLDWRVPDTVVVPVGDGCILSGVWKGFVDLYRLGWIERLPRLAAVQAEGSQAIKRAFEGDGAIRPVDVDTIADSISVALPRNGAMAVQDLRASAGLVVAVTDREIIEAMPLLGETTGIFAEPAAAAALAGLRKLAAARAVSSDERVVVLITGHGLKDIDTAMKGVEMPEPLDCSIDAVAARLDTLG